jgi:hypothetical protein
MYARNLGGSRTFISDWDWHTEEMVEINDAK